MLATPGSVLRPLGIGEILDRAVNLCVRNFLRLSIIYVVFMVPYAFVQYYATKDLGTTLQAIVNASKSGSPASSTEILRQLGHNTGPNPFVLLLTLLLLAISPLPTAALIAATAAFYLGTSKTFAEAYGDGFARYFPLLGVTLLFSVAGGLVYLVVVLLVVALVFAIAFLYSLLPTLGVVLGVIVGVVVALALIGFFMLVILAGQLAYVACVVDRANFAVAFTRSIGRVFAGGGLRRSFVVALAFLAITFGITIVAALGQGVLVALLNAPLLGVAYAAVVRVVSASFTTAFAVIYYYDVRVREEGLDLQLAAAAQIPLAAEAALPSE